MPVEGKIVGKNLVLTVPLEGPKASASGKTLVVASSRGNVELSDVKVNGKPITVGINAYIRP